MSRIINPAVFNSEFFLARSFLWNWQVNDYPVVMVIWNCLLGAIAIAAAILLARAIRQKRKRWQTVGLTLFWLLFMPNAAYIMADVRHLIGYCPAEEYGNVCGEHAWMTLYFFAYAAIGWLGLIFAIRPVRLAMQKAYGALTTDIATVIALPLIALGFLLGLVNRWNSWDIVNHPLHILASAFRYGSDLTYLKNWIMVSILLTVLYFVGEKLFKVYKWEKGKQ